MDPFTTLADRLETLPLTVRQATQGLVETFGQQLLDYNRNYLARQGQRPDGEPIQERGYSPAYAAYRRKYGLQTAFVDLKLSGAFSKAFQLDYQGGLRFEVTNLDPKAAKLLATYGELYGVRESDIEDFVTSKLLPDLEIVIAHHMNA